MRINTAFLRFFHGMKIHFEIKIQKNFKKGVKETKKLTIYKV